MTYGAFVRTAALTIDIVEELFESVGIILSDEEAQQCLQSLQPNQVNKYSLQAILVWWARRPYLMPALDVPDWRHLWRKISAIKLKFKNWVSNGIHRIQSQQTAMEECKQSKTLNPSVRTSCNLSLTHR